MDEKVRENRIRRMAERQGLVLRKSRRRDPYALDYGRYWLVNQVGPTGNWRSSHLVAGGEWGFTLDEVEEELIERGKDAA